MQEKYRKKVVFLRLKKIKTDCVHIYSYICILAVNYKLW